MVLEERLLREKGVVSYRSVSKEAGVTVSEAKIRLAELAGRRSDVTILRADVNRQGVRIRLGGERGEVLAIFSEVQREKDEWAANMLAVEKELWETDMREEWSAGNWLRENGGARVRCSVVERRMIEKVDYGSMAEKKKTKTQSKPTGKMAVVGISDKPHVVKPPTKKTGKSHRERGNVHGLLRDTTKSTKKKKETTKKKIELCADDYDDEDEPEAPVFDRFEEENQSPDVPMAQIPDEPAAEEDCCQDDDEPVAVVEGNGPQVKAQEKSFPKDQKVRPPPPSIFGNPDAVGPARKRVAKERTRQNGKYIVTERYYVYVDPDGNEVEELGCLQDTTASVNLEPVTPAQPKSSSPAEHKAVTSSKPDMSPITPAPNLPKEAQKNEPPNPLPKQRKPKKARAGQTALSSFFGKK